MTNCNLNFERVSRHFGRRIALQDFTLQCPAGVVTCMIGPNGAGKSTALALAAGLISLSSGRILLGEQKVRPSSLPKAIGYLPQQSIFPPLLTAGEVLDFAVSARGADTFARMDILTVTGLEPVLNQQVRELSGGWVRRLGLASALMPPSRVLLLDEPFVGLDPETLDRLVEHLVYRTTEGEVIVLASHEFEVIDLLTPQVAILDEGRLLRTFPAEDCHSRTLYRQVLMEGKSTSRRMGGSTNGRIQV